MLRAREFGILVGNAYHEVNQEVHLKSSLFCDNPSAGDTLVDLRSFELTFTSRKLHNCCKQRTYRYGWQGQTRLMVARATSRSFRCLGLEAYHSLPLFARAASKGKVCWLQGMVGFQATICALMSLLKPCPCHPSGSSRAQRAKFRSVPRFQCGWQLKSVA